jgi:hypothetical protein
MTRAMTSLKDLRKNPRIPGPAPMFDLKALELTMEEDVDSEESHFDIVGPLQSLFSTTEVQSS